MKIRVVNILFVCLIKYVFINSEIITDSQDIEEQRVDFIAEIILRNLKNNGWNNILFMGHLTDLLYHRLKQLPFTFTVTEINTSEAEIEDVVPYHSNIIVMACDDAEEFEKAMKKIVTLPYWHPLANIILYYHAPYNKEAIAKMFYIYWYYSAINVVIIQYHDTEMLISHFSPYMSENYKLSNIFGCWKARKIGMPIENFNKSFVCDTHCQNVTSYTKIRALHLGTCIGFDTEIVPLPNRDEIKYLNLFEDKGKNLHGFTFYSYTVEVIPYFIIEEHGNGSISFHQRDGMVWNTMAELLNFKIDILSVMKVLKSKFNFELQINQVFSFCQRKADLLLYPVYQQDLTIDIDVTFPYTDSGVCILSHRAGFETIVFDINFMEKNITVAIELFICLFFTWFVYFIYNREQRGKTSFDQAGKDFINTIKTVLSISVDNPPKRESFRIFLTIVIWSYFVINFSIQALIISLFSVHKKEKEVDTFDDVIRKGYDIEGLTSTDVLLPDTEELFRTLTSRIKSIPDYFDCIKKLEHDTHLFCLIDCAIGRYYVRNFINKKGKQFLHIASEARIHSNYLNTILHKNSPLTENYNKYIMILFESGIVKKWMEYKNIDFKDEDITKPLGMEDLGGIFECYGFLLGICLIVFLIEVFVGFIDWLKSKCRKNVNETIVETKKISPLSVLNGKLSKLRKVGKSKVIDESAQTA